MKNKIPYQINVTSTSRRDQMELKYFMLAACIHSPLQCDSFQFTICHDKGKSAAQIADNIIKTTKSLNTI